MISVEDLLQRLALRSGAVFAVGERTFHPREVLGAQGFSFMPMVVLQAIRDARELSVGIESELDLEMVGAQCVAAEPPFGVAVTVRSLGDEAGVLRGLLFQQAAERVFGWNQQGMVDLQAVLETYRVDGYAEERDLLEAYSAAVAARQDVLKDSVELLP